MEARDGLDHGIGHFRVVAEDSEARAALHRFQNRRKHRPWLLTEKSLRGRRPVRPREEKVVNGRQALPLAGQIEASKLMVS